MSELTRILQRAQPGDGVAAEQLLTVIYEDLRRLARARMATQPPGHTLQATALVHEAWLRLSVEDHGWQSRAHFLSAAAEAMRRILVDQARRKHRIKRGGARERVDIQEIELPAESAPDELLGVHEALDRLAAEDPVKAEVVKLRYFVGLRISEVAEALGISATTAKRHWVFARAWLSDDLKSH